MPAISYAPWNTGTSNENATPQFDHCAVIVAEDITSRFLNVIGLFNSAVPIIALQLNALQVGENIVLDFAKVLDEVVLGEDDDDNGTEETTDRAYWEKKGSQMSMAILDECLEILREVGPNCQPKYNKFYVGISESGLTNNFVVFRPKKKFLRIEAKVTDQDAWKEKIDETGFVLMQGKHGKKLRFTTTAAELKEHRELLKEQFAACYREQAE